MRLVRGGGVTAWSPNSRISQGEDDVHTSIIRGRGEKALHHCQVKVDLILDEVESKVHVDSTEFIYCIP
jgi:hypothetical protein